MTYYQEPTSYYHGDHSLDSERDLTQMSMFGNVPEPRENGLDYDPVYDDEVNKLLEEFEEDLNEDSTELKIEKDDVTDREQYEDYYDEFLPEEPVTEVPLWHSKILKAKHQEAIDRLRSLSLLVGYASRKAWDHMKRVEQDHHTPFCKLNPPRHPPLKKPWQNYWRFNCATTCNDPSEPNHAHTLDCDEIVLQHVPTLVSTKTKNIIEAEFPDHVMRTVEMFQNFINREAKKGNPYLKPGVVPDTVYEKPMWHYIKLRANYKNEIMMIVCGKGLTPLLEPLKKEFRNGPGRVLNVTSMWCINIRWSQKKSKFPPTYLYGEFDLRDKVGPITIKYCPKNNISFNSAEAEQLGRIMMEYLKPTQETTVIDIGCNFGALSLMLATKADKVIGLNNSDHEIELAQKMMLDNKLTNASFIVCKAGEVHTKCSPFVKRSISVAVLNLSSHFGKNADVMKSLRNLPTVWRVALYGTFDKEFQKHITILTSSDHHLGDEFLPMQGCVLERSPSVLKDFSIIVVFERKSLLEPSIDLIGCGPTVNVKEDVDSKSVKIPVKIPGVKISELVSRGYGKFRQFDSPALPKTDINKDKKPIISPPSKESEPASLLPPDYGKPAPKKSAIDIAKLYDSAPNPTVNRQLKKIYDSPLLPKMNNSIDSEQKRKSNSPPLSRSYDQTESKPPLPISTDPRCDFLNELMVFNVKKEPFDQKKVPVPKKERNHINSNKPKNDKRFDYSSMLIKNEKSSWSTSSQDSNPRSPPPVKKESHIEALTLPVLPRRDIKAEATNSILTIKRDPRFNNPPLPEGLPSQYSVAPSYHTTPPPDFSVPPLGFNVSQPIFHSPQVGFDVPQSGFNVLPPIPKMEPPFSSTEREEGELSPDSTKSNKGQRLPNASNQSVGVFVDAIIKTEPMDLDEDNEGIIEYSFTTAMQNTSVKSNEATPKQKPVETFPMVQIKSEPINSRELSESTVLPDSTEFCVRIKTEPIDSDELVTRSMTPPLTCVKQERGCSPVLNTEDLMTMPTPIHKPVALDERSRDSVSPPPASANFQTIDGFKFSVQPNQSYLLEVVNKTVKKERRLDEGEWANVTVKSEPCEPETAVKVKQEESTDKLEKELPVIKIEEVDTIPENSLFDSCNLKESEVEIVSEKKHKKAKKERSKSKNRKREIEKKMDDPEIRKLYEDKKKIKKQLKLHLLKYERSPSSSPDKKHCYRSPSPNRDHRSRSPPTAYRRINRSSPSRYGNRLRRPLSPIRFPSRSPSPRERRSRRSPVSPVTRRSWKRSPSPIHNRRLYFARFQRSSVSPRDRRSRYSSRSPSRRRFIRSPDSRPSRQLKRFSPSPSSRSLSSSRRFERSPSPYGESSSMCERRRTRSPSARKYSHSALGDYAYSTYKTKRKSAPRDTSVYKWVKPSATVDSKKRKSPPSGTSKIEKKKFKDKNSDQWDIQTISDLSPLSDTIANDSPDKQSLSSISTVSPALEKDEIPS